MAKIEYKRLDEKKENKEENVKLIVASNIKQAVPELQVAGDVPEALSKKVQEILKHASERAKLNGRRTLYARDL